MPHFSTSSREKLCTCDDRLIRVASEVIAVYDFCITCGHRSYKEQERLYAQGRTTPGQIVTWTLESYHNYTPALAFDFCPWTPGIGPDWANTSMFHKIAGAMLYVGGLYGYDLTWGGDWPKRKRDMPHVQVAPRTPIL